MALSFLHWLSLPHAPQAAIRPPLCAILCALDRRTLIKLKHMSLKRSKPIKSYKFKTQEAQYGHMRNTSNPSFCSLRPSKPCKEAACCCCTSLSFCKVLERSAMAREAPKMNPPKSQTSCNDVIHFSSILNIFSSCSRFTWFIVHSIVSRLRFKPRDHMSETAVPSQKQRCEMSDKTNLLYIELNMLK